MWLSAGILNKDPIKARTAAREFRNHLKDARASAMNKYEQHFFDDHQLMEQLEQFGAMEPPVVVWRGHGRFAALFIFLAIRFLGQPDSVLQCEGVHAQWQWLALGRRGISLKLLNALLKLAAFHFWFGDFPEMDQLLPILQEVREGYRMQLQQLRQTGECPAGTMRSEQYKKRFNLSFSDIPLLKASMKGYTYDYSYDVAWSNYIRRIMAPRTFYRLSSLTDRHYFFVAENKSFIGRDKPAPGEVVSRTLAICWFEKYDDHIDGAIVVPVHNNPDALKLQLLTPAEIARASGDFRPAPPGASKRDEEIMLELAFLGHDLVRYNSKQETGERETHWQFIISGDELCEEAVLDATPQSELTKIMLARALQLREGLSDQQREKLWNMSRSALLAMYIAPPLPASPAGPAAAALAKGKGKGKGAGLLFTTLQRATDK